MQRTDNRNLLGNHESGSWYFGDYGLGFDEDEGSAGINQYCNVFIIFVSDSG